MSTNSLDGQGLNRPPLWPATNCGFSENMADCGAVVQFADGGEQEASLLEAEPVPGAARLETGKKPTGWNTYFRSVAPAVMEELGEGAGVGQVSTVVANMWRMLPDDRKKDWKDKAQRLRDDMGTGVVPARRCPTCKVQYSREKDLKYHQKGCHECICFECGDIFNHKQKLKRHVSKEHREKYKCNQCNKTFAEKRNLTRHQKSHSPCTTFQW